MNDFVELSREELVQLAALDSDLFMRAFFPNTVRQESAPFHPDVWQKLESDNRLINLLMYRGSGKTSICRGFTGKSVSYVMAHTILYIGKSEAHAIKSTSWLKKHVEHNPAWCDTFKIRPGSKWQDTEFEIIVGEKEEPVWIIAAGITGSIRGINRDDWRPELIVLDDVLDDENAHTPEQRKKIENLVYGALAESLAPASEAPHAKMVALNTPQNREDFAVKALKDPNWVSAVYGCFTKETRDYPLEYQESSWPTRFPTETLRKEKKAAQFRNTLSTFLREKECKLVSTETASFKLPWLKKYYNAPEKIINVYAIDPVPPPSEATIQKGLHKTDFEAHVVWGLSGRNKFLREYRLMRGHEPTWTISTFFAMQQKYQPITTVVETVAYQRVLMWILQKAMQAARQWYTIEEWPPEGSKLKAQSKYVKIISALMQPASTGELFIKEEHVDFIQQFATYPDVANDDLLDASAMALIKLKNFAHYSSDSPLELVGDDEGNWMPLNVCRAP